MRHKILRGTLYLSFGVLLSAVAFAAEAGDAAADKHASVPESRGDQVHPVDYFFQKPKYTDVSVSPNGKYLAALAPLPGNGSHRQNIVVLEADNLKKGEFITAIERGDVLGYTWANNDRILFSVDTGGTESYGLYGVDRTGGGVDELIAPILGGGELRAAQILDVMREDDDNVLISFNDRLAFAPDVYKMNVNNGDTLSVARNPGDVSNWLADHDGNVRVAVAVKGVDTEIRYRDVGGDWQTIASYTVTDRDTISPVAFAYDNKRLIVRSTVGDDTASLRYFDPHTKKLGEVIYNRDDVDVGGPIMSDARKTVIGASYAADKPHIVYFDPREQQLYHAFEQQFPKQFVAMTSWSRDEHQRIYMVSSDTDPGTYFQYSEPEEGRPVFKQLLKREPWVDTGEMVPRRPVSYEARDGLTIHGYLTLPDKDEYGPPPYPMIVNPHGGPFGIRDQWGYNPEHQFLADRGYAVLQVNFRGSGGYGMKFLQAGYGQWGRDMQNDISDGVKWAIDQKYARADQVCIYGGSYGGYATMAGLAFTPDLYQCGIDYVGVTSIPLLFETLPKAWELQKQVMEVQIGDPDKDRKRLEDTSPINHVKNIDDPILIVHGKRDPRVDIEHAERLRDKLDELGKPYQWLVKRDEGHGFRKEENVLELYRTMDAFLAKYLPTRPAGDEASEAP